MGITMANLVLTNPKRGDLKPVSVRALADTGSVHLCIPESVMKILELEIIDKRPVILADDSIIHVPYAGPIMTCFENRVGFTGALVMGNTVLLGAIPMEDMDLIVVPRTCKVVVNPESPEVASSIAK
ncbi:MAG: clan AA aspartic protease [Leptospirales bacterium]